MNRYDYSPRRGGHGASPVPVAVYNGGTSEGYGPRTGTARPSLGALARQDSGLIRVLDDAHDSLWNINIGSIGDYDLPVAPPRNSRSPGADRPLPLEADRYTAWDLDEAQARRTVGRIATPGAWAAVAIVLLAVLAFVFVSPAFAGVGSAISRYRDLSGTAANTAAAPEPVIDASSRSQPVVAAPAEPASQHDGMYSVIGAPSLSVGQIEAVLQQYGSPAVGLGQKMYDLGVQYGIDPAYALAFFAHESGCGTQGVARFTRSLGNIRWTPGWDDYSGYRLYSSWEAGMEDWYKLITDLYINQWGLRTVDDIIPVYAPVEDNNSPSSYIASVKWLVDDWRGK